MWCHYLVPRGRAPFCVPPVRRLDKLSAASDEARTALSILVWRSCQAGLRNVGWLEQLVQYMKSWFLQNVPLPPNSKNGVAYPSYTLTIEWSVGLCTWSHNPNRWFITASKQTRAPTSYPKPFCSWAVLETSVVSRILTTYEAARNHQEAGGMVANGWEVRASAKFC